MEDGKSLDELLGEEVTPEVVEATPEPEPTEPEQAIEAEQARGVDGRFAAKGVEEDTVPPTDKLPREDYKALREERDKRQAIEREFQALKEQFAAIQNPPAPPPSIWEDEQGWQQDFGNQVVSNAVQQASFNAKLDMSEMMVRQANPDFEDVKAEFLALAATNPTLREQALTDPHPWNKAYQIAKNHRAMQELGATDMDTLKAKLREELMAEMGTPAPRQGLPPTLTGERNVGTRTGPAWSGPKSLDDLLR